VKFAEAYVELIVRNDKLKRDMEKGNAIAKTGFSGIANAAKAAGTAIAGYLGARMLFRGLSSIVGAAAEADNVMGRLEQVLIATGYAAGFTAKELDKEAMRLQKITRFSDDSIKSVMALLATFREIKGKEFLRITELVLDFAEVTGRDAAAGALQFGKALNAPVKGVSALNEAGVQFTDTQLKMIKALVESGRIVEAQNILLTELDTQFGNVAQAAGARLGGQIDIAKNAFEDLKKKMGAAFVEGSNLPKMLKDMGDASENNSSAAVQMANDIGKAFNKLVNGLQFLYLVFKAKTNLMQRAWMEMALGIMQGAQHLANAIPFFGGAASKGLQSGIDYLGNMLDENKQSTADAAAAFDKLLDANYRTVPGYGTPRDDKSGRGGGGPKPPPPGGYGAGGEDGLVSPAAALKSSIATVRSSALGAGLGYRTGGGFSLAPISLPSDEKPASEKTQQDLLLATQEIAANTRKDKPAKFGN